MSVADRRLEKEKTMPVRDLPMPPVKMQRIDVSSGSALVRRQDDAKHPIPQLVLNLAQR